MPRVYVVAPPMELFLGVIYHPLLRLQQGILFRFGPNVEESYFVSASFAQIGALTYYYSTLVVSNVLVVLQLACIIELKVSQLLLSQPVFLRHVSFQHAPSLVWLQPRLSDVQGSLWHKHMEIVIVQLLPRSQGFFHLLL